MIITLGILLLKVYFCITNEDNKKWVNIFLFGGTRG